MIFDKGYSIKIDAHRCLNHRYSGVECRHCISHCPAGAIVVDSDHVDLRGDLCVGCGLCLSDCPTQVFRSNRWDETTVIGQVKDQGWTITEFFCANHSAPYRDEETQNRGALQLPACLSVVSRGAWYELGLLTEVALHLEQCDVCPMSGALSRLNVNIGMASEWLSASGHIPRFSLIRSHRGNVRKSLKAVEAGFPVTSRRDLFLSFIQGGRQFAASIPGGQRPLPEENDSEKLQSLQPNWLTRLAEVYSRNMAEGSLSASWPTIHINSRCDHCGLCTLLCPSGALKRMTGDGACQYSIVAGFCLDCRICQMVCEQEAVFRDKKPVAQPFETAIIYSSPIRECERCLGVASDQSAGLCHWCGKEKAIDQAFKEACHALLGDVHR